MSDRVVVRSTGSGNEMWSHEITGQPFIDYVPSTAFHLVDSGEATIETENYR